MDNKNYKKKEIVSLIILIVLFFKPLFLLWLLGQFNIMPGVYYSILFISLIAISIIELILLVITLKRFTWSGAGKRILLPIAHIIIVLLNLAFSLLILIAAVP